MKWPAPSGCRRRRCASTKTLRFYEDQGLLPAPARGANGYRDYPSHVVDRVRFIKQAQAAGLTLGQIRQILAVRDDGTAPCAHVRELVAARLADVEQRLEDLRLTRERLRDVRRRLERLDPADCDESVVCAAIT